MSERFRFVYHLGGGVSQGPSVVIPALNEEGYLLGLIEALHAQTLPPAQIIVADAGSTDRTRELAAEAGCIVVDGGKPSVGRNAGAALAEADVIVFLDADVVPPPTFLADAIEEFDAGGYAVATALIESLESGAANEFMAEAVDLYLQMTRPFSPHAPGACIFVRREAHIAVGGFNEHVVLAEDHDYVQRVSKIGEFGILTSVRIPVSMRRMDEERIVPLAVNYLWCEMHALVGKPVLSAPFEYSFGSHAAPAAAKERVAIDLSFLGGHVQEVRDAFEHVSVRGREQLDRFVETFSAESGRMRVPATLDTHDLAVLRRYLRWRIRRGAASMRRMGSNAVRRTQDL